ncbi:MAG: hypothetical protein CME65_11480 [Halobacteriovoraceae bacterium]|nr:hypothetical protein [Halobacteriovoraceae bacterium]
MKLISWSLLFLIPQAFSNNCNLPIVSLPQGKSEKIDLITDINKVCSDELDRKFKDVSARFVLNSQCQLSVLKRNDFGKLVAFEEFNQREIVSAGEIICNLDGSMTITNNTKSFCFPKETLEPLFHILNASKISFKFVDKLDLSCPKKTRIPDSTVVLIMIDGFSSEYVKKFSPPFLNQKIKEASFVKNLTPVFPSETTVSLQSIITGVEPNAHGLVGSKFYSPKLKRRFDFRDNRFFVIPPLWITLEQQAILSAVESWPGSEVLINGRKPRFNLPYERSRSLENKLKFILTSIKNGAKFVSIWIHDIDSSGHRFFNDSERMKIEVLRVDSFLSRMFKELTSLKNTDVQLLIASDHGMNKLDRSKKIDISSIDFSKGILEGSHVVLNYHDQNNKNVQKIFKDLKKVSSHLGVYLRNQIPEEYRYNHNSNIGDLTLIADPGWIIDYGQTIKGNGVHGYLAKQDPAMNGVLFAIGNKFKTNFNLTSADSREIHSLIIKLLNAGEPSTNFKKLETLQLLLK